MTRRQDALIQAESHPVSACSVARAVVALLAGLVLGALLTGVGAWVAMPRLMITSHVSPLGLDETVEALEAAIAEAGWSSPGTMNLNASLAKHGRRFEPRVRVIKLCNATCAADVLTTDRRVSCLMPCSIAVWEGDDGTVMISKLNTGLMGRLFGGNVARVMGGPVAADEARILAQVLNSDRQR
jgi:uncharacterized protein (DUF302 family)